MERTRDPARQRPDLALPDGRPGPRLGQPGGDPEGAADPGQRHEEAGGDAAQELGSPGDPGDLPGLKVERVEAQRDSPDQGGRHTHAES
jgi:hypothetical protein